MLPAKAPRDARHTLKCFIFDAVVVIFLTLGLRPLSPFAYIPSRNLIIAGLS